MSSLTTVPPQLTALPDHTQLPDKDGVPVMNSQEAPQSRLLSDSVEPVLRQLHPDGHYFIGQDTGIYWRFTDPPLRGCKAPDWFYVAGPAPLPSGQHRRSYVLWHEVYRPRVALEYASDDGSEERDRTPMEGKFWVYEQGIVIPYYGIFVFETGHLEMYRLANSHYEPLSPNAHGRFEIPPLQVELGVWQGTFANAEGHWLRWWNLHGTMLLTGTELAVLAQQEVQQANARVAEANSRAAQATAKAERLAAKMRELGLDPNGD